VTSENENVLRHLRPDGNKMRETREVREMRETREDREKKIVREKNIVKTMNNGPVNDEK